MTNRCACSDCGKPCGGRPFCSKCVRELTPDEFWGLRMASASPMHQPGKRGMSPGWGDRIDSVPVMETWPSGDGGEVKEVRGVAQCSYVLAWAEYSGAIFATAAEIVRRRWSGKPARRDPRAILKA